MGDHNVRCDRSGFICKRSECREEWNGNLVRADLWEPRHPQDILRPKKDNQAVDIARPDQEDPPKGAVWTVSNAI